MVTGWQYRLVSTLGVLVLTVGAVAVANHPISQHLFTTYLPLFNRLEATVLTGQSLYWALALSVLAVGCCLVPLYKPQPRRVLDTTFLVQKRVLVAGFALASLGYFKWSHRLPRATLVMTIATLGVVLPLWFVWIRHNPDGETERTLVVGDDFEQIERIRASMTSPVLGYLCPSVVSIRGTSKSVEAAADGGITIVDDDTSAESGDHLEALPRLGGLSRLENVLLEHDVGTVVLAFHHADRAEFFGALDTCHNYGVDAKVHREYADSVLVSADNIGEIVDVDIEPWDPLDHLFKRVFDIVFALTAATALLLVITVVVIAIKIDSPGPVLYKQERTAVFGESFSVYKFRSMVDDAEADTGARISAEDAGNTDPRVTRVGRFLRQTHLDEIPQLWSILYGNMSVVGPRPERPELDTEIQSNGVDWSKRWFVKPGLTGLAQINDVTGHEPEKKLRYDLEYVRRQSFWLDLKIIMGQVWNVLRDVLELLRS
ncbi:sugar transferase [Natrarchaeobius sp. A-rgal3]|uniref:sugar transferase n=1 Tax=Natrarchaeobius versutus TaxID=1679078 RepID=UPI00350F9D91